MAIPNVVLSRAEPLLKAYCDKRIPARFRDKVRLLHTVEEQAVTLHEERPRFDGDPSDPWTRSSVARFRYTATRQEWTLYWRDRHARWHRYDDLPPTSDLTLVLAEVDRDPTGIFWG